MNSIPTNTAKELRRILDKYINKNKRDFSIEYAINLCGGSVKYNETGEIVSHIEILNNEGDFIIEINSDIKRGLNRIILATELAHWILHIKHKELGPGIVDLNKVGIGISTMAKEANKFVLEFLLPADVFLKEYNDLRDTYDNKHSLIEELSKIFNVTYGLAYCKAIMLNIT